MFSDEDSDIEFEGFEPDDFHKMMVRTGETDVTAEYVQDWLEENDADPWYQVLSMEEIAKTVLHGDQSDSSSDLEEEVVVRPRIADVRDSIDTLIQFVDVTDNREISAYYKHLCTLRELIICEQYSKRKQ